jgi:hypothetical protein
VHGWPGLRARDLIHLGLLTARHGHPDPAGWPTAPVQDYSGYADVNTLATHPHDPDVLLGGVGTVRQLPMGVDAVVSLCRLGADEVPASGVRAQDHVEVWLIDSDDPKRNAHLPYVLAQAADAVTTLRQEGHSVLVHCVQAQSRTPTVAALYAVRRLGVPAGQAISEVRAALPASHLNDAFRAALVSLTSATTHVPAIRYFTLGDDGRLYAVVRREGALLQRWSPSRGEWKEALFHWDHLFGHGEVGAKQEISADEAQRIIDNRDDLPDISDADWDALNDAPADD